MNPTTPAFLSEQGVKLAIIDRITAVFGTTIPSPPPQMLGYQQDGAYHALNEFYAMKIILASGKRPSVKEVLGLVGGAMKTVHENVKLLRSELPAAELEPQNLDGDATMEKLKRELIKEERLLHELDLAEQEEFYVAKISEIEAQATTRIAALEEKSTVSDALIRSLSEQLKGYQTKVDELHQELKAGAIEKTQLANITATAEDRQTQISTQAKLIQTITEQYEHYKSKSEEHFKLQQREKERLLADLQKANKHISDQDTVLIKNHERIEELMEQITKLEVLDAQHKLEIHHEEMEVELIQKLETAFIPLQEIISNAHAMEAKWSEAQAILKGLNTVSAAFEALYGKQKNKKNND